MALGNGYRNAAADDHCCRSSGRQYLASRGPQPLVDHTGIHSVVKLDRPVGVCIRALAESRQLECPLWVISDRGGRSQCPLRPESDRRPSRCDPSLSAKNDRMHRSKKAPLFDHLVGGYQQRRWHLQVEGLRGLEVDDQFELDRLLYGQIGGLLAPQYSINICRRLSELVTDIDAVRNQAALIGKIPKAKDGRQPIAGREFNDQLAVARCEGVGGKHQTATRLVPKLHDYRIDFRRLTNGAHEQLHRQLLRCRFCRTGKLYDSGGRIWIEQDCNACDAWGDLLE